MAVAEPLIDELGETFGQLVFDPVHGPTLVRAAKVAQDLDRAEQVVRAADRLAAMNADVPSWRAAADHANGLLYGDVARIRSAVHCYSASGRPLAAATALADVVDLLHQRQDPAAATVRQEAMAGFTALGADGSASRLAGMRLPEPVRADDTRPMKRSRAERPKFGWDSLTEAELRVVVLAATGATNKEIASRLWLSPYTVDTHMRHSLSKLGLRSRVALARLVGERGLMAPPELE
jgi:DNA-binding CsgD family transcriptional regulator